MHWTWTCQQRGYQSEREGTEREGRGREMRSISLCAPRLSCLLNKSHKQNGYKQQQRREEESSGGARASAGYRGGHLSLPAEAAAEPSWAERPINSCAQLSHLSTQSISHNGNSRQRRLIDRAAYPSPLPLPCHALPRRVPQQEPQSNRAARSARSSSQTSHFIRWHFNFSLRFRVRHLPPPAPGLPPLQSPGMAQKQRLFFSIPVTPFSFPLLCRSLLAISIAPYQRKCQQSIKYI